jgi:flagellar hook assembly protein FlgD
VYDAAGREVVTLESGWRNAGAHSFPWDGRDASGRSASPGVYFVRATQLGEAATAKVVRVR